MMFDLLGLTHLGSLGKDCHAVVDEVVVLKPEAPARFEGCNDGHTEVVIQLRNTSGNPSVQPFPTGQALLQRIFVLHFFTIRST